MNSSGAKDRQSSWECSITDCRRLAPFCLGENSSGAKDCRANKICPPICQKTGGGCCRLQEACLLHPYQKGQEPAALSAKLHRISSDGWTWTMQKKRDRPTMFLAFAIRDGCFLDHTTTTTCTVCVLAGRLVETLEPQKIAADATCQSAFHFREFIFHFNYILSSEPLRTETSKCFIIHS